jgi:16S rRNA (cytidine1402-2'-O)-methyltransferase
MLPLSIDPWLSQVQHPALYVLATPIGNLGDITLRGLAALSNADLVLAEDTRITGHLLHHWGLHKPLRPVHAHNEHEAIAAVIANIQAGQRVVLVTDAGTPCISDPGGYIVDAVRQAGCLVVALPGASAVTTGLSGAGLPPAPFYFHGFLPTKSAARQTALQHTTLLNAHLLWFEAPHRIPETLHDIATVFAATPDRRIVLAHELTKHFESYLNCTVGDISDEWCAQHTWKGEWLIMLAAPSTATTADDAQWRIADEWLAGVVPWMPIKAAAQLISQQLGLPKKQVYERALQRKERDAAVD